MIEKILISKQYDKRGCKVERDLPPRAHIKFDHLKYDFIIYVIMVSLIFIIESCKRCSISRATRNLN